MVNSVLGFAYAISLRYLNKIINSKAVIPLISVICGLRTTMFMLLAGYSYKPVSAFVPVLNIRTAAFAFCIATYLVYNRWFENVDILYKLIAFLTLGVILMAISYLYNKLAPNK